MTARQGINDLRYLLTLQKLMERAEASQNVGTSEGANGEWTGKVGIWQITTLCAGRSPIGYCFWPNE